MTDLSPIILFVYARPDHTRKTVEALQRNELASESELIIYSDAPKKSVNVPGVRKVRNYINNISGFRNIHIIERSTNFGLANSIITGVSDVINRYKQVIILEDDIITDHRFLTFMNECLDFYREDLRIGSVTGYSLPIKLPLDYPWSVYLTHRHSSWGWGTYDRVWKGIDWDVNDYNSFFLDHSARCSFNVAGPDMAAMLDSQMAGKIDSWSIRFDYNCFRRNLLSLASVNNLVRNIGFDGSGVHCGEDNRCLEGLLTEANEDKPLMFPMHPELDQRIVTETRKLFTISLMTRIKQRLKSFYKIIKTEAL